MIGPFSEKNSVSFCYRSIGSEVLEYLPSCSSFNEPIEIASMYDSRFFFFFWAASAAAEAAVAAVAAFADGGGLPETSWPDADDGLPYGCSPDAADDGRALESCPEAAEDGLP